MIISPARRIRGCLTMPGDKSISHRAAMIAALARGTSRILNYSNSADCASTLSCLREIGVRLERDGAAILIHGIGQEGLRAPDKALDCGNSGTTIRLLAGILAGQGFKSTLTGDGSLRSRPMQRLIEPLEMMGAQISSRDGRPPLTIGGKQELTAIDYELLIASAQVKSCILFAGLNARGTTTVIENEITRDHTERMLSLFGAGIETGARAPAGARYASINGPAELRACEISIPGDISSAAYFVAAAALVPKSILEIRDVGINPTRSLFLKQLRALGFDVAIADAQEKCNEPVGVLEVRGDRLPAEGKSESPFVIRGSLIPQLIDELPLLAIVGSQSEGGVEIRDAKELRVKESDRIAATVDNLQRMGAEVEEFDDGFRVNGRARLRGATIDPRGDHRIAMAFSVAALVAEGDTEIRDDDCVAVSFPEFFETLGSVAENSIPGIK